MATAFEAAAMRASRVLDERGGEEFQFLAMRSAADVDAPRMSDSSRPTFPAMGIWYEPSRSVLPHARGAMQDDNAHGAVLSQPRVSVDNRLMPWRVTTGDRVRRVRTGDEYEVAKPIPDGVARPIFALTARKR